MDVYRHTREAVRVKVRKCEPNTPTEWRKFSVDPQITTLEVLNSLLAKAFDIKSDFTIKYKAFDPAGNEIYLPLLSDWDLDAAFLRIHNISIQTASEPCLVLQMLSDVKPFSENKECDNETPTTPKNRSSSGYSSATNARDVIAPLQQTTNAAFGASQKYVQHMQTRLPGLIMNQMEKTFSMVQKAFNLTEETIAALPPRPSLSDNEFRTFLDALGQIQRTDELRKVIFFGGIEPSLRRVVWKHILNVYPSGMNGHQRMDYMRRKSEQYIKMREAWKNAIKQGCVLGEIGYVTSMVKKDVLRTDRLHSFYAGSDDNQNIASLFNILTTYALNHPSVTYCQGMSDIASPLLVTMNDEAQAYICFCAIMFRVRGNFMLDGIAMTQKFAHLSEALSFYDPQFWEYLKSQQADDLLFCYRWLLLELKREFPFDDALRMLEVQWSSLKYETSGQNELKLFEKEFVPITETSAPNTGSSISSSLSTTGAPTSPVYYLVKPRENAYSKFCALRRQSSTASLSSLSSSLGNSKPLNATRRLNQSLDDNISKQVLTRRQRQVSSKAHQSLDEAKMLMLIESSEKDNLSIAENEGNNSEPTTAHAQNNADSMHFQFHPTNPFKDDAYCNNYTHAGNNKPITRTFLYSSSSSIAEDESQTTPELPTSIAKLQNKNVLTNYNTVSNIISKQLTTTNPPTAATTATVGSENVKRGGHFKDLKEKIAATSKQGLSFEEIANATNAARPQQKLVKNFNEFLNFAALNRSRIADQFSSPNVAHTESITTPQSPTTTTFSMPPPLAHPVVQLTKSSRVPSLEDSDSTCSIPDTTWSNSTAATAIQQAQSLQLELNSNYSYTPDRTPCTFSPLKNELANDAIETPDDNVDTAQDYYPITTAITRELRLEADNLDRQVFGDVKYEKLDKNSLDSQLDINELNLKENEIVACADIVKQQRATGAAKSQNSTKVSNNYRLEFDSDDDESADEVFLETKNARPKRTATSFDESSTISKLNPFIDDSFYAAIPNSNSLPEVLVASAACSINTPALDDGAVEEQAEIAYPNNSNLQQQQQHNQATTQLNGITSDNPDMTLPTAPILPPPHQFGGGNPFLMFLCLTLLLQHRNTIMKNAMDYNEIAMHFDKMVRKHDVTRVLNQARRMYIDYLKVQNAYKQRMQQIAMAAKGTQRNYSSLNANAARD